MPELPEVETVKRSLEAVLPGRTITGARVSLERLLQNLSSGEFIENIAGRSFLGLERRGKYLVFRLSGQMTLVVHLRMTGQLRFARNTEPIPGHTHIVLELAEGYELRYTDIRQFGFWFLAADSDIDEIAGLSRLGPEPLGDAFTPEYLGSAVSGRKSSIKALLLDQRVLAGVGNIYADEALFLARIRPDRPGGALSHDEVVRLHLALRQVLRAGVDMRGTTFSDYVDGLGASGAFQHQLNVYGRRGEACRVCGEEIGKSVVVGRGTHFCRHCQR